MARLQTDAVPTGAGHPWLPLDLRMRRRENDGFYEREHYYVDTPKVLGSTLPVCGAICLT